MRAETARLAAELERLGKSHEFHTYDGAGHAFFSVNRPAYRPEAATDGWRRILDFSAPTSPTLDRHRPGLPPWINEVIWSRS